jgi:two-component system, NtrC family, nitrogen regulation response regulator NtrX
MKEQRKILVIDDEPELRELMKDVLEDEGYQLFCAGSGADGIALNTQEDPDLILLDMRMPEMDGIATLRAIRTSDDQVPVIILTGYGCPDTIRDAADLDVSEYLSKPFENRDLVSIIANAFEL